MRTEILWNNDWLFSPAQLPFDAPDSAFEAVTLPHTNKLFPHHNFDNAEYQFISTYRKRFSLPEPRNGRRVFVDFEGAMLVSTVYLNGKQVGVNAGGYTPFSFDVTDYLNDGENVLTVHLDSTERADVPPFGYVVDYLTFGGIYRDVHLRYVEAVSISNAHIKPQNVLTPSPVVELDVYLVNSGAQPATLELHAEIYNAQAEPDAPAFTYNSISVNIDAKSSSKVTLLLACSQPQLWTLANPALYALRLQLHAADGTLVDAPAERRFGFREAYFADDGFYLNGERVQLRGLNRHQTYPYIGAAAPARLQQQDADILKYELGCNIVRTSHYPQSHYFLDRCDEIGLLVFEEIPGWQHIGDNDWQAISLRDVRAMITRDWNHPSIIVWGVRINESWDNDEFYTRTNALAHELDPTRQTTGVRFFIESSFLEDVFSFNDFSNGIAEPKHTPHLVTEYNGHMFPTKTFDGEERKIEHARRHAHVQNMAYGNPRVSGAIGWCAFDYNTHKEFGSGDRICYHGVMDIFRLPKWAAAVYASQQDPTERVVLETATLWTMGDRAEGGNDPLMVLSNVEEIDVWFGEQHLGRFLPDHETYPHLPHPPFKVTGLGMMMMWGQAFGTLRVEGFIGGEKVIEQQISSDGVPRELRVSADFDTLYADGADMTPVKVRFTDEFGNVLPYAMQPVTFELEGDAAELIGENPLLPPGGQAVVYLKATHTRGTVTLTAKTARFEPLRVTVEVI